MRPQSATSLRYLVTRNGWKPGSLANIAPHSKMFDQFGQLQ